MKRRDMSQKQFDEALKRRGMEPWYLGYVQLSSEENFCVNKFNGGTTRREQLAYLIAEQAKRNAKLKRNER